MSLNLYLHKWCYCSPMFIQTVSDEYWKISLKYLGFFEPQKSPLHITISELSKIPTYDGYCFQNIYNPVWKWFHYTTVIVPKVLTNKDVKNEYHFDTS